MLLSYDGRSTNHCLEKEALLPLGQFSRLPSTTNSQEGTFHIALKFTHWSFRMINKSQSDRHGLYQGVTPWYFNIYVLIGLAALNACDYTHVAIPKSPWWWLCRNDRG